MMKRVAILLFVGISLQGDYAAQPERSTSPSRQFVIYGADPKIRGAVSSLAEQTKANLLALLRQRDDWKTPVVVNLQSQQANLPEVPPADLRFSQTGFGIKLQLDVTISKNLDVSVVERELVGAVLLEMVYRKQTNITAGAVLVKPPDWLIDGVLALVPGRDRGAAGRSTCQHGPTSGTEELSSPAPQHFGFHGPHALSRLFVCLCANVTQ